MKKKLVIFLKNVPFFRVSFFDPNLSIADET